MKLPELEMLQIETTTVCNARCKMCPRALATRSRHSEFMAEDIFWSAVEQAVDIGVKIVVPFIDGEPFADARMVDFVEGIAARFPRVIVCLYTNASLLTAAKADRLLRAGNIKEFNVSMQGGDKETYESTTGLQWERTIANVERLIEINAALGSPVTIRANMCVFGPTKDSVKAFKERWEAKGAAVCLGVYSNFGGMNNSPDFASEPRKICKRATRHIYVFWNGDVGQCCFDLVPTIIYGNLEKERLADILLSDKYQAVRAAHLSLNEAGMPLVCQNCNSCKFNG